MSDPRRARSFLTPRGADGTGGQLIALQGAPAEPVFAEPVPYWAVDEASLEALRQELAQVERALTQPTDFPQTTRLKARRDDLRRQIASADLDRQRRQRGEQARNVPPGSCRAGQPATADGAYRHTCSCGNHQPADPARFAQEDAVHAAVKSVLVAAQRATQQHRARGGAGEERYAEPVPYFATA